MSDNFWRRKRRSSLTISDTAFGRFLDGLHINPNLIMLKVTLFVMYGATASLLPYLTIHMQSIGLTVEEIAIVYLALPLTTFLSPPVTGYLMDKLGRYKPVVVLTLILSAVFHHSLVLIPHMETPGEIPAAYVMRHPRSGAVEVWWSPCPSRECPDDVTVNMVLDSCEDHCLLSKQTNKLPGKRLHIIVHHHNNKTVHRNKSRIDTSGNNRTKENANARQTPGGKRRKSSLSRPRQDSAFLMLKMHPGLAMATEHLGIELEFDENQTDVTDFTQRFNPALLLQSGINLTALQSGDLRCGGIMLDSNITTTRLKDLTQRCIVQKCNFRRGGPDVCPPDYRESEDRVFWIYFFLRFIGTLMLSAGVTMLDPIALSMIQQFGGEFGRERLYSTIGMAIFSPLTGFLIDTASHDLEYTDYSAAFYTYDILMALSAVTIAWMPLGAKMPGDKILRDLIQTLLEPHVSLLLIFLFFLGNFWGFIESFLFLYLKELGAPNYLLGITVTVGSVSSIPFLYGADWIMRRFGHINIVIVAFFSHAARLVGYSLIEDPWWCFPFEAMEALAVHLMWVAAATYCANIAPKTLLATLIGVMGMFHFSLGRGSGSFVGGLLIGEVGTRQAFRLMGLISVVVGFLYGILQRYWLRGIPSPFNPSQTERALSSNEMRPLKRKKSSINKS